MTGRDCDRPAGDDPDVTRPRVLFVDDNPRVSERALRADFDALGIDVRLRHPEAELDRDLTWADLVVVDYFLDDWVERDEIESVARKPMNGLAATASMRSTLLPPLSARMVATGPDRIVAFAIVSGNLDEATFDLPAEVLPHVFSRENNLEWAFRRQDLTTEFGRAQIASLAHAVTKLSRPWPTDASLAEGELLRLLNIDRGEATGGLVEEKERWRLKARSDVLDCRPPMHELSVRTGGMSLVRWLLHRILPYPCFLYDELQLCCRLRVDSLGRENEENDLRVALQPYAYQGVLDSFDGARWWRAGVEDWLFGKTGGLSGSPKAVAELATQLGAIRDHDWIRPVVTIDGSLTRSKQFAEVGETVRVRPDDWPLFADDAFALRTTVIEEVGLKALVEPLDRDLLNEPILDDPS